MVSDDSESMVPLGDHLTSHVKILTRSLIIHGHVSKLENFHTLLKTLFPSPSCMHPDLRSTCSTCSESLLYSIIAVRRKISAHWSAFFLDIIPRHFQAVMNHLCAQRHMSFIQHPANGPGKRGIALGFLAVLPAREIEGVPGTLILAKVPGLTEQQVWTVGSIYLGKTDRQATPKLVERALELATRDHNRPIIIGGDWNVPHATLQRKVSSWGFGLHVVSFSGSKATFRGRTATARWSSIDHFVCNQAARALLTSPRVNRQPCKELAPTISLCNQFSILANLPDDCDSDTVTNRLLDIINPNTAFSSLSNLPLIDTPVPVQHRRLYRATTKKAICKAKKCISSMASIKRLYFESPGNHTRNEAGVLQFQPISICNTLRSHYMRLAEAGEGHSLDPTHWETMPQPPQHIPPSSTLSMDLPFSLRELDHALR
ncbi:hypothetical protein BASA83_011824 [Batrachochytrium salamandrivorans]|nr:hypothetical protein BASA83_011824 [Batrachochytrium salamandrivorans]